MNIEVTLLLNPVIATLSPVSEAMCHQWFQTWVKVIPPEWQTESGYEVSLAITDDPEIQALNLQYRHQDKPTDVLAFATLETDFPDLPDADEPLYLGDVVISLPTASRQATERGHSLVQEIAWLAAHGFLHLLGWDHPDEPSLVTMLDQQDQMLAWLGNPL